jgi:hypothetical protein
MKVNRKRKSLKKKWNKQAWKWGNYFWNCLWNGPWKTVQRIPKNPPCTSSNYSSPKLKMIKLFNSKNPYIVWCGFFLWPIWKDLNNISLFVVHLCLLCVWVEEDLTPHFWCSNTHTNPNKYCCLMYFNLSLWFNDLRVFLKVLIWVLFISCQIHMPFH